MNDSDNSETLRLLPSVDALLHSDAACEILSQVGAKRLTVMARTATDWLRRKISEDEKNAVNFSRENLLAEVENRLKKIWRDEQNSKLRKVINATGVIVHTNLGRAPLSENARQALIENASRYCNLEYDTTTGKRGKRGAHVENLLAELTGAENALIVNNCAAAAFLVLTVFAKGGEAIVSRGELVEIGGDFRVPDVMEQSGAILREVGTTNRTRENDVLLYEDAGSGALFDLSKYGLTDEPVISDSIKSGADIVTFSGDKLLGGAQSGLIVGRRTAIERIRKHPLYRALRVDKLIYAALEATLETFRVETALQEIPVLKMLSVSQTEIKKRIEKFADELKIKIGENSELQIETIEGNSVVGGGSAPTVQPATVLLALKHRKMSAASVEEILRMSKPPIIARVLENKVLIDLRTVFEDEEAELLNALVEINAEKAKS
jgi:L-seryl-tRNA(Ser) seleniumtransferase